jgi:hypothetical protein
VEQRVGDLVARDHVDAAAPPRHRRRRADAMPGGAEATAGRPKAWRRTGRRCPCCGAAREGRSGSRRSGSRRASRPYPGPRPARRAARWAGGCRAPRRRSTAPTTSSPHCPGLPDLHLEDAVDLPGQVDSGGSSWSRVMPPE